MTTEHPITPPPELVEQWIAQIWHEGTPVKVAANDLHVANQAARWGADQELEACVEWLTPRGWAVALHEARRPKPPSLAEEALNTLGKKLVRFADPEGYDTIRAALERLKELEKGNE